MPLGPLISMQLATRKFMNNFTLISDLARRSKQYFLIFTNPFIHIHKFKPNTQNQLRHPDATASRNKFLSNEKSTQYRIYVQSKQLSMDEDGLNFV